MKPFLLICALFIGGCSFATASPVYRQTTTGEEFKGRDVYGPTTSRATHLEVRGPTAPTPATQPSGVHYVVTKIKGKFTIQKIGE